MAFAAPWCFDHGMSTEGHEARETVRRSAVRLAALLSIALGIASAITAHDVITDPAGVHRSGLELSDAVILETFVSWFWPLAGAGLVVGVLWAGIARWAGRSPRQP